MGIIGDYVHVDITSNVAGTSSAKQRRLRDCAQGCASDGSEQGVAKSFRCGSSITLSGLFRLGKLFLQANFIVQEVIRESATRSATEALRCWLSDSLAA